MGQGSQKGNIVIILLCIILLLFCFSVHMVIVVLRQYRQIKEAKRLLEMAQQRIIEHKEERQRWRQQRRELIEVKGRAKQ